MRFQADDAEMMLKKIPEAHPHTHTLLITFLKYTNIDKTAKQIDRQECHNMTWCKTA
jgi:hypothetical protein